jgi:hypothetical protein
MKKAVVICLIIPTIFPFDAGSRVDNVHHTSGYFFMLDPASKGNVVGMIRQMTRQQLFSWVSVRPLAFHI